MANRDKLLKRSTLLSEFHIPLLMLASFAIGAGGMWVIMRTSSSNASGKPPVERLASRRSTALPTVSNMSPAEAARTLADWHYDRQNWPHAIDDYQEAIAKGADNPYVRTDRGNCSRFICQPQQALYQYH